MKVNLLSAKSFNYYNKELSYNSTISFGVGDDYANDEFLSEDGSPNGNGNTWGFLKALGNFFWTYFGEIISDKFAFRNAPSANDWGDDETCTVDPQQNDTENDLPTDDHTY